MGKFLKNVIFCLLIVMAVVGIMDYTATQTKTNDISYTEFMKHVQQDEVRSVSIQDTAITGKLKNGATFTTVAPDDASLIPTLRARDVEIKAELPPKPSICRLANAWCGCEARPG